MFTRILVPTDFSDLSDAALDHARELARTFGGSLHILHVVEAPNVPPGMGDDAWSAGRYHAICAIGAPAPKVATAATKRCAKGAGSL